MTLDLYQTSDDAILSKELIYFDNFCGAVHFHVGKIDYVPLLKILKQTLLLDGSELNGHQSRCFMY